jgi:dihydroxy-acid dehydratase
MIMGRDKSHLGENIPLQGGQFSSNSRESSANSRNFPLRSGEWFAREGKYGFVPRSWMRSQGFGPELFDGRPVIGICNTWSELTNCNRHLRELAEHVKRGVLLAGGFPLEFPVMSMGEPLMRPTTMMFRNLVAMDVEESIRANPLDGVVLLAACDKTTPAVLMGAASCDVPAILVSGGPMLNGRFRGRELGSGTDVYRLDEEYRTGRMSKADLDAAEAAMSRSAGSCMTMGTASTMASLGEAMGIALPMNGSIPAADSRRAVLAQQSGQRIVEMVRDGVTMSQIITRQALENAVRVNGAIGGSTNAVVHLLALAGRLGIDFVLEDWDRLGRDIPTLVDLKPSGRFLMEEFFHAGGLPVVMKRIADRLHLDARSVTGGTIGEAIADAECYDDEVIRPLDRPLTPEGGIMVLKGNLAPNGAIIKPSAASPRLMQHRGRALVFESNADLHARIDDPDLDVDADTVLVLKHAGPVGYPGMPEAGTMALPKKLVAQGVTDMVRVSDARMSGTAFGTVILHVAPEAAVGGPLALVRTGDMIIVDTAAGRLDLDISAEEFERRRAAFVPPAPAHDRGYGKLYIDHVQQADKGVDFDFLVGKSGTPPSKVSF